MTTTVNGEDGSQLFSRSSRIEPHIYAGEGRIVNLAQSSGTDCMFFPIYNVQSFQRRDTSERTPHIRASSFFIFTSIFSIFNLINSINTFISSGYLSLYSIGRTSCRIVEDKHIFLILPGAVGSFLSK